LAASPFKPCRVVPPRTSRPESPSHCRSHCRLRPGRGETAPPYGPVALKPLRPALG
jgi:hypothetical protein